MNDFRSLVHEFLSLHIKAFTPGRCFLCSSTDNVPADGFVHIACATAYEDRKKAIWEDFRNSPQAIADAKKLKEKLAQMRAEGVKQ